MKASIVFGSNVRISGALQIDAANFFPIFTAAFLTFWKSDSNIDGTWRFAWAIISSDEIDDVRPCAYCSVTHSWMCLTPGCRFEIGS